MAAGNTLGWWANTEFEVMNQTALGVTPTEMEAGFIGTFHLLGATIMCIFIGVICDLIGRRMAMLIMIIPFLLGW